MINSRMAGLAASVALVALLLMLTPGAYAQERPNENDVSAQSKKTVEQALEAIKSADAEGLLGLFTESMAEESTPGEIADFLAQMQERHGPISRIDSIVFESPDEAMATLHFEEKAYDIYFILEEGLIDEIKLTMNVPDELKAVGEWADLGEDTLRLTQITNLAQLRTAFQRDSGYVRLVSLLSPT